MASKFKREFKNVVYNYSDAEAKVREATSNDPWGPSSAVMSELSDYTYHVEAYGMVMGMLWKRLNDHGKNWRHVYKALVVLEYLIKTGSERVYQQCKENLFSIQTLKDFQYIDKDGKDQGITIREKAKNLVSLLKDEDRLKEERRRAIQARDRQGGISSDGVTTGTPTGTPKAGKKVIIADGQVSPDNLKPGQRYIQPVEQARPGDSNEEDMQLKLAIQLSKQQAEEEEKLKSQEEESLRAAMELSKAECNANGGGEEEGQDEEESQNGGNLLLDFSTSGLTDPWSDPNEPPPPSYDMVTNSLDPWTASAPPGQTTQSSPFDPWGGVALDVGASNKNSSMPPPNTASSSDPWSMPLGDVPTSSESTSFNPFDLSTLDPSLPPMASTPFNMPEVSSTQPKKVEDDFLGDLADLVNLDSLTNPNSQQPKSTFGTNTTNPFGNPMGTTIKSNPFEVNKPAPPTLNQLASSSNQGFSSQQQLPAPMVPSGSSPLMQRHQQPQTNGNNLSYNPFS